MITNNKIMSNNKIKNIKKYYKHKNNVASIIINTTIKWIIELKR